MALTDRLRAIQALSILAPGDTPLIAEEPQQQGIPRPRQLRPKRPRGKSREWRLVWRETLDELEHLGILDRLDKGTLIRYCAYRVEWEMLSDLLRTEFDYVITYDSGAQQVSAIFTARRQVEAALAHLEGELGLTPASRARLLFASYGGRPLAAGKPDKRHRLRGEYRKGGAAK